MIYRRKFTGGDFSQIHNDIFENPNLSAKAKGILGYLLTKPAAWKLNINDLIASNADGRDAIIAGVNELVKSGYIIKKVYRGKGGHFESDYDVYDTPQNGEKPAKRVKNSRNRNGLSGTAETDYPERENRNGGNGLTETDYPERENRNGLTDTENPLYSNTDNSNTNFSNTHFSNTETSISAENSATDSNQDPNALKAKKNKKKQSQNSADFLPSVPADVSELIEKLRGQMQNAATPEAKQLLAAEVGKLKLKLPVLYPFETPEFLEAWNDWKLHHKGKTGKDYKTNISEQAQLVRLNNLAAGVQEKAIQLIYTSIENNWTGIHDPEKFNKNNGNGNKFTKTAKQPANDAGADYSGFGRALI